MAFYQLQCEIHLSFVFVNCLKGCILYLNGPRILENLENVLFQMHLALLCIIFKLQNMILNVHKCI
jgi:hypothetical protein